MTTLDLHIIQSIYKKRLPNSNKGNHGHALIIAGSKSKMGGAVIATKACLRTGAGLVTVNVPKKERLAIFNFIPEAMIEFRNDKNDCNIYSAVAIGPGIGVEKNAEKLLFKVLESKKKGIVLDADALTIIAKNQILISKIPQKTILTPHPKEFDRLFGNHTNDDERRAKGIAKAKELQCIIVLKGHKTFVTDGKESFGNSTGNSGLAKGGSGDALTGIITAFIAQGYEPIHAALLGVYIHGFAADITLETQSEESMLITDVIENLGKSFKKIQN
ncbi:NAD(P)H-hydrate dehydratase [Flavobacterium sp.]|uniref:NAD(P)H-hydrate dehydratase n=1 Tax=Flavobacterium sp. TaxID=239 RepID=UPI002488C0A8|nr:NAD(P)H-hydrate dehydratase [Flavobacterium sp.]MDI1317557.1 NAD(P)H-hydrate dehydratase [Flavobacterium sp.]